LHTKPYISQSRHGRAQDSLAPGEDNQVIRENAGWSRSPQAQGSLLLMLGVLRWFGQHGVHYHRSPVKHRERDTERLFSALSYFLFILIGCSVVVWCSVNALVSINVVILRRARLVLGWVTFTSLNHVCTLSVFNHKGQLSLVVPPG